MKAWLLNKTCDLLRDNAPLVLKNIQTPKPNSGEILIRILCCGVCHTELDEIEGRTPPPQFPVIPGHQVIGIVESLGTNAKKYNIGDRVGVAWIYSSCGNCEYCLSEKENLCRDFKATGRDKHGGYAEYMTVGEHFSYLIPNEFSNVDAAPLLCAGAIGYRSLKLAELTDGQILGLTGFGASGHLVLKMASYLYPAAKILVFARSNAERRFSKKLGAYWAGDITDQPPFKAHAIIDTTPVWKPLVGSLLQLRPAGKLVINAIRKESADQSYLREIRYQDHLWMEKEIKSVANITRKDVEDFLQLAATIPIRPETEIYPFEKANKALLDLKQKHLKGAKVLVW